MNSAVPVFTTNVWVVPNLSNTAQRREGGETLGKLLHMH